MNNLAEGAMRISDDVLIWLAVAEVVIAFVVIIAAFWISRPRKG